MLLSFPLQRPSISSVFPTDVAISTNGVDFGRASASANPTRIGWWATANWLATLVVSRLPPPPLLRHRLLRHRVKAAKTVQVGVVYFLILFKFLKSLFIIGVLPLKKICQNIPLCSRIFQLMFLYCDIFMDGRRVVLKWN